MVQSVESDSQKPLVLLIANSIVPYRLPVYRYLAQQENFRFHVCYLNRREGIRRWSFGESDLSFPHSFLPGTHLFLPGMDWALHINFGLLGLLLRLRPTIVVSTSWETPAHYLMVLYGRFLRFKRVLWAGTFLYRKHSRNPIVWRIKSWYIKQFHAYLSYGSGAADYLVEHGAKPERIAVGFNTVDINFFIRRAEEFRRSDGLKRLRKDYPGRIILYVGRFLNFKGADLLLDALSQMKGQGWTCLLIGWGPEEKRLREQCASLKLKDKVQFIDYFPAEKLVEYYVLARVLVVPSRVEPWGLVVNEGMACGTPVVVSNGAGSSLDLIEEGETGFRYPCNQTMKLAEILDHIMRDDALCQTISKNALGKIRNYTPEYYAQNLMKAMFELGK